MLTGPDVLILESRPPDMLPSLGTIWFHGPLNARTQCRGQAQRLNIGRLLMVLLKPAGCANCFMSYIIHCRRALWCIVTVSAVYLSSNPVQHQRTKHVEIDLHFVRERVSTGDVRVLHVPTTSQFADIFTKGLPTSVFAEFRSSLNVVSSDALTAGGC